MEFTNTITINRRPAEVFRFLARFENVPLWNYAISDTRKITSGSVGVGSRYRQTRTLATPRTETFEVTEFEPDRRLSIDGSLGPFRAEVTYLLTPAGDGTALTNTMHLQPPGRLRFVAPLVASRIKSAVAANLDTLRQILEASAEHATEERGNRAPHP
jgi:uncharacterized protein YndB with AHSA1/START domain